MFYKHGSDFAADMKRQINTVRTALKKRQRDDKEKQIGPFVAVVKHDVLGRIVAIVPEPARISPARYHAMSGNR